MSRGGPGGCSGASEAPLSTQEGASHERYRNAQGQPVRHLPQQTEDLPLQTPKRDPASDGHRPHRHHRGSHRGHCGGHLQDPRRHHRRPPHRAGQRIQRHQLHRSLHQQAGQSQPVDPALEYGAAGGGDLRRGHSLRRHRGLPGHPHQPGLETVHQLHFHLPLHHAPVDPGGGVAEPVQLQRRHRHPERPGGRADGNQHAHVVV